MDSKIGNELLADIMGFTHTNHGWEDKYGNVITEVLDYDKDWNHLMKVVDKCFEEKADYQDHKEIEDALIGNHEERIHKVWVACVHFVQHKYYRKK
jgi:hypothetical protein